MNRKLEEFINSIAEELSDGDILAAEQLARISAAIAKERIERNMTQKEFAELLGVSQGMISKWESEDYNFSIETLADICAKLDLDFDVSIRRRSSQHVSYQRGLQWNIGKNTIDNRIAGVA